MLREGKLVPVYPLLFTQGINEQQTIANTVGDSTLQEELNRENIQDLQEYFKIYKAYLHKIKFTNIRLSFIFICTFFDLFEQEIDELESDIAHIEKLIQSSRREKNVEILAKTADFTRRLLGGRATCCKSAKDRTCIILFILGFFSFDE